MDALFDFLISVLQSTLYCWRVIQPDERGVRTTCGCWATVLDAGLHFMWPVVGDIVIVDIAEQSLRIESQSLTTQDGASVGVGVTVTYKILDPIKAVFDVVDWDESLRAEITGVVGECVLTHQFDDLCNAKTVTEDVITELRKVATERWGLKILRVRRSDFAKCRTIRLMREPDRFAEED